jgi:hypothetical protein
MIPTFTIYPLVQSSILYLYGIRNEIYMKPQYQRLGGIWTPEKRQLLIDSIINGFDIPKIYFHENPTDPKAKSHRYAIIDGRQRLESVWGFINGEFPLDDGFRYLHDKTVKAGGLEYKELAAKYPKLKSTFDATTLSIFVVQTRDPDLIEDMFSRLNEAVPLNAAEKRNAFGGPAPRAIRLLAARPFFKKFVSVPNKRYQHYDLAAKFLYLEYKGEISDVKKEYLDKFVRDFKFKPAASLAPMADSARRILKRMTNVFRSKDPLLRSQGMVVLYYLLFMDAMKENWIAKLRRKKFEEFEEARAQNQQVAEKDVTKARYDLLEFDRYSQTPNDAYAIRIRLKTLKEFVRA